MRFEPAKHLKQVIEIYQSAYRAGLVEFDRKLKRYNPINVLQVRKIDKNGLQQEFDSSSLNNGHIAALIAILGKPSYRKVNCSLCSDSV